MPQAIIAAEALLPDSQLRRSHTRGAALRNEVRLATQHQYSLVPNVPHNRVQRARPQRMGRSDLKQAWPASSSVCR
jgi:hypothetical protein